MKTTDYVSGLHYENDTLRFAQHAEGRVRFGAAGARYDYALRDHLGNTRVLFSDTDSNGCPEALQVNDYYPFGLGHATATTAQGADYQYLYNGKELQEELGLGWYDYGARLYQPETGRWNGVDALGEKYLGWSPFNYVMGNPVIMVDPDGREVVPMNLSEAQKAMLQQRMANLQRLAEKSPTIKNVLDKANDSKYTIHVYSFSSKEQATTNTKSKNFNFPKSLEAYWNQHVDKGGGDGGLTLTGGANVNGADLMLGDVNLDRGGSSKDKKSPSDYSSDLVLLDELSHATSPEKARGQGTVKEQYDHYLLFSSLLAEMQLIDFGEFRVYCEGQINSKLASATNFLSSSYEKDTGKHADSFKTVITYYNEKYENEQ